MKSKTSPRRRAMHLSAYISTLLLMLVAPIHQVQAAAPTSPATGAYEDVHNPDARIARFGMECGIQEYCFGERCERDEVFCMKGALVNPSTEAPGDVCRGPFDILDVKYCVKLDGDIIWVKDTKSDGHGGMGEMGEVTSNSVIRGRVCMNREGAGNWVRCNFDWPEGETHNLQGGEFWNYGDDWLVFGLQGIQD